MEEHRSVIDKIAKYYGARLEQHGATPRGVDWNSLDAQLVRFDQLFKIVGEREQTPTILDYGCGYGAFADYVRKKRPLANVLGYDASPNMIEAARYAHPGLEETFTTNLSAVCDADYVVASGIFSVKMDVSTPQWESYIESTIDELDALSTKAFAFNMLTIYSDEDRMRGDLYYGDPHRYFDQCRKYSRNVALLHDYDIYEFTIHVRKVVGR